jgi:hypothetical protein
MNEDSFVLYSDDTGKIICEYMPSQDIILIHFECKKWSVSVFKHYKKCWDIITQRLVLKGYTELYAPKMDEQQYKFTRLFGFKETEEYLVRTSGIKRRLLKWVSK